MAMEHTDHNNRIMCAMCVSRPPPHVLCAITNPSLTQINEFPHRAQLLADGVSLSKTHHTLATTTKLYMKWSTRFGKWAFSWCHSITAGVPNTHSMMRRRAAYTLHVCHAMMRKTSTMCHAWCMNCGGARKKTVSGDYEETSATCNMLASQRDSWNAYECRALDAKHASAFHSGLGGRQQHCWCSDARNDKRLICAHCDDDTRRRRRRQNALFINTSYGILHIAHRHTIGLLRYAFWALLENVPQHKMWMWRTVERTCCTYSRHGPTH